MPGEASSPSGCSATVAASHLYVCETCARDQPVRDSEITAGRKLFLDVLDRLTGMAAETTLTSRAVVCLNGCPKPCFAALRGRGKWTIRFGRLTLEDAPELAAVACAYASSPDGAFAMSDLPGNLGAKVSALVPPPRPRSPG